MKLASSVHSTSDGKLPRCTERGAHRSITEASSVSSEGQTANGGYKLDGRTCMLRGHATTAASSPSKLLECLCFWYRIGVRAAECTVNNACTVSTVLLKAVATCGSVRNFVSTRLKLSQQLHRTSGPYRPSVSGAHLSPYRHIIPWLTHRTPSVRLAVQWRLSVQLCLFCSCSQPLQLRPPRDHA